MAHIILDTNVISELMRAQPDPAVLNWFEHHAEDLFYTSAITQAEIKLGIALLPAGKRRTALAKAADTMFAEDFTGRCLPFDSTCSDNYAAIVSGRRRAGFSVTTEDAQIAAIALAHNYHLATRNTKDFMHIEGLVLHNPWQP